MFDFEISGIHLDDKLVRKNTIIFEKYTHTQKKNCVTHVTHARMCPFIPAEERGCWPSCKAAGPEQRVPDWLPHAKQNLKVCHSQPSTRALCK